MGGVHATDEAIVSVPPSYVPLKIAAPVSPSQPVRLPDPPAATIQTIAFEPLESVVVTMGEPFPPELTHHAVVNCGGFVALILTAMRSPLIPAGQLVPLPSLCTATYVPVDVVYAAAEPRRFPDPIVAL